MKAIAVVLIMALAFCALGPTAEAVDGGGRGGLMGFFSGCCFGLRTGLAYNEGKELHWRDWAIIIPYVGLVFAVWNGIDCYNGATSAEFAEQYGAMYY